MRSKVYLVVLALVAAGLVGWRACGGAPETAVGVTADLAGIWKTTSPGHIDRHFEIRAQEIVFGQGDEGEVTYPLVGVVRTPGPEGQTKYVLRYRIDAGTGAEGSLELLVGPSDLRIASQPGIRWTLQR